MQLTIISDNGSVTTWHPEGVEYGSFRYVKGKNYEVCQDVAAILLAQRTRPGKKGQAIFGAAITPPPDPLASQKERAVAIVDALAALPEGTLANLEALLGVGAKGQGAATAIEQLAKKSESATVTNTKPRIPPAPPAGAKPEEKPPQALARDVLEKLDDERLRELADQHQVDKRIKNRKRLISALLKAGLRTDVKAPKGA